MLVSVIVPVYNVERYISKCIDSILKQTFTDFELILIDDGSSDNSFQICKQYESSDSRIRVYSQKNSGPSRARNNGISKALGEYITFVDSDDYLDSDYLFELTKYQADLVSSGFKLWYAKDNRTEYKSYDHFLKATKEDNNIDLAIEEGEFKYLLAGPCCKLYKKEILLQNMIFFDETLTYGEDHLFNLNYLQFVNSIVILPYSGYIYTHYGKQSLTNRIIPYEELYRYNELCFKKRNYMISVCPFSSRYKDFILFKYYFYFCQMILSIYFVHESRNNRISFIKEAFKNKRFDDKKSINALPMTYKILLLLFNLLPLNLADFIVNLILRK